MLENLPSYQEANQYFRELWAKAENDLQSGNIVAAQMEKGHTVPINYCVSTVARIIKQQKSPFAEIQNLIDQMQQDLPTQFFYDQHALHISLLGCTPRLPRKASFLPDQLVTLETICKQTLSGQGEIRLYLKGIGLIGNQVFIQVFPLDNKWAFLRQILEDRLLKAGEHPISYPNKSPIHLNIMRIIDDDKNCVQQIEYTLRQHRDDVFGFLTVTDIEFLITDFVIADISILADISLANSS